MKHNDVILDFQWRKKRWAIFYDANEDVYSFEKLENGDEGMGIWKIIEEFPTKQAAQNFFAGFMTASLKYPDYEPKSAAVSK